MTGLPNDRELIVPMITPRKDEELDVHGFRAQYEMLVTHGASRIFLLGHTGEFEYIPHGVKRQVILYGCQQNQGSPWVGVMGRSLEETMELAAFAEDQGVEYVVFAPGYLELQSAKEARPFFKGRRAKVILYNNPHKWNQKCIPPEWVASWNAVHPIYAVKDSSGDNDYFHTLEATIRQGSQSAQNIVLYQGAERNMPTTINGPYVKGIVAGSANIYADEFHRWLRMPTRDRWKDIEVKQDLIRNIGKGNHIQGVKRILHNRRIIASEALWY